MIEGRDKPIRAERQNGLSWAKHRDGHWRNYLGT